MLKVRKGPRCLMRAEEEPRERDWEVIDPP